MKYQELRIGNFLHNGSDVVCVEAISPTYKQAIDISNVDGLSSSSCFVSLPIADLKPVPLTGEWLLRFGFVQNKSIGVGNDIFSGYEMEGFIIDKDFDPIISTNEGCFGFSNPVKYVHQLQNLVFALTGKELELI